MANATACVVITLMTMSGATDNVGQSAGGELQFVRVKPADPEIRRLITDGYLRSEAFRALVGEIQQSSVLVIVQFGECAGGRFRSCVTNVEGDGRQRNVRVKINTRTTGDRLIATIAHELRHVIEILADPDATDATRTLALYRRIGEGKCRAGLSEACETKAALDTERQVLDELDRAARR
jgi:hypothetical protein